MIDEQVLEGNKVIAEFMGYSFSQEEHYTEADANRLKERKISGLDYHSNWGRLMPVVKKVNNLLHPLTKALILTQAGVFLTNIHNAITEVDIEKSHEELVKAINWYNKNK